MVAEAVSPLRQLDVLLAAIMAHPHFLTHYHVMKTVKAEKTAKKSLKSSKKAQRAAESAKNYALWSLFR